MKYKLFIIILFLLYGCRSEIVIDNKIELTVGPYEDISLLKNAMTLNETNYGYFMAELPNLLKLDFFNNYSNNSCVLLVYYNQEFFIYTNNKLYNLTEDNNGLVIIAFPEKVQNQLYSKKFLNLIVAGKYDVILKLFKVKRIEKNIIYNKSPLENQIYKLIKINDIWHVEYIQMDTDLSLILYPFDYYIQNYNIYIKE